jgi:hypothetical protein
VADPTPDDTGTDPSPNAEARRKIDAQQAEIATLKKEAAALGQMRYVERFVRSKGIANDATVDQWVDTIMPKAGTITFESEAQYGAALDASFGNLIQTPTAPPADPSPTPPAEGVIPPTPAQPADPALTAPGFAGPNPGTTGQAPDGGKKQWDPQDPYLQQLKQENNWEELRRLNDAGDIDWHHQSERYGEKKPAPRATP